MVFLAALPKQAARLATAPLQSRQVLQIALECVITLNAILEALKIAFQLRRRTRRKRVDHPVLLPRRDDHPVVAQIGEMLGNFDLRFAQHVLKMTNAEW